MSRSSKERSLERDFTRFPGYGDRVGSGVEFAPTFWTGGELVTDPGLVNKSLKPRRMYYSPIGDGVVAADGIEMKRGPRDLTPRVEVIHQRIVEKGTAGRDGVRVVEKQWTSGGDGGNAAAGSRAGSEFGGGGATPDNGRDSRAAGAPSPFGGLADPLGLGSTGLGSPQGPGTSGYGTGSSPRPTNNDLYRSSPKPSQPSKFDTLGSRDPYSTLGSTRSEPPRNDYLNGLGNLGDSRYGSNNDFPQSGRTSTTSALFSEPGMRYEMKKDYLISNPKELIHQYATQTPVQTIEGYESLPGAGTITKTIKQSYSKSTTEETYAPYAPYHAGPGSIKPNQFVRQIRDEGLTPRQQQANQNQESIVQGDIYTDRKFQEIRQQTTQKNRHAPDVDSLTDRLLLGLQTGHPTPPKF
uniref:Uncharacterized protein n=1 Tax=Panagrolaimus sp. ES5 TaxID=591445 RepID=A0AC34F5A0_9BILA